MMMAAMPLTHLVAVVLSTVAVVLLTVAVVLLTVAAVLLTLQRASRQEERRLLSRRKERGVRRQHGLVANSSGGLVSVSEESPALPQVKV
jgi:hypothetical protein